MIEKTFNNYVTILRLFKLTLIQVKLDNLFKIKKKAKQQTLTTGLVI